MGGLIWRYFITRWRRLPNSYTKQMIFSISALEGAHIAYSFRRKVPQKKCYKGSRQCAPANTFLAFVISALQ